MESDVRAPATSSPTQATLPLGSGPSRWETSISMNDGNPEKRNCPSPLNPLSPPPRALGIGSSTALCDDVTPVPVVGPPPSRGCIDSCDRGGLVTDGLPLWKDPSPPYDASIEDRQRIFGHNILPACPSEGRLSEIYLVLKEFILPIVNINYPSIPNLTSVPFRFYGRLRQYFFSPSASFWVLVQTPSQKLPWWTGLVALLLLPPSSSLSWLSC